MLAEDDTLVADQSEPHHVESDSVCDVWGDGIPLAVSHYSYAKYWTNCARDFFCVFGFTFHYISKPTYHW